MAANSKSPFYSPGSFIQGGKDWRTTPFVTNFLDPQIPEGVFASYLGDRSLGGTDAFSTWVQGLYGKTLAGYKAGLRERPDMRYSDYLHSQFSKPALRHQYLGQTARSRGENPSAFQSPTRFLGLG